MVYYNECKQICLLERRYIREMTNTELLNEKIEKSGLKIGFISDQLGMTRQTFRKKVNGISDFNQTEMKLLCDLLKITSMKEKNKIFFDMVQTELTTWRRN